MGLDSVCSGAVIRLMVGEIYVLLFHVQDFDTGLLVQKYTVKVLHIIHVSSLGSILSYPVELSTS